MSASAEDDWISENLSESEYITYSHPYLGSAISTFNSIDNSILFFIKMKPMTLMTFITAIVVHNISKP